MSDQVEIEIAGQKLKFVAVKLPIKICIADKVYFIHRSDFGGLYLTKKKIDRVLTKRQVFT